MTELESMAEVKAMAPKVARCMNLLEGLIQNGKRLCNQFHWNDEVFYQLEEATQAMGYAMATLLTWDEDLESDSVVDLNAPQGLYVSKVVTVTKNEPGKEK